MSFIPALVFFLLSSPMPEEFDFSLEHQFRAYSRMIIVFLCMVNLGLYFFNTYT